MARDAHAPAYNGLGQFRSDAWSALEESAGQLALAAAAQRPVADLETRVQELLGRLEPVERFWAFPGPAAFQHVQRLFAAGKYDRLAGTVTRVNRALVAETYRSGRAIDLTTEDDADDLDLRQPDQSAPQRPYFEVLIIDDLSEAQERALREEIRRGRRSDDPFVYEVVIVPSFDEAVLAARLNFALQACVVCRRFAHRSGYDLSALGQFAGSGAAGDLAVRSPAAPPHVL